MRRLAPLLLSALLLFGPALAEARPGLGSSMGSRGSQTYSAPPSTSLAPSGASPFSRSMTPGGSSYGSSNPGYGSSGYGYNRGYGRSSFTSGLMGGLLGAGIGGMLFGRGFFGFGGGMGFLGLILQLVLLFLVGRWLLRTFFGGAGFGGNNGVRAPATGGGPGAFARNMFQAQPNRAASASARRPVTLTPADYQAFEQLLRNTQAAWTAQDLNALRNTASPEMVGYFGEQLAELSSRGVRNQVQDVRLQQGDLSEAWAEGNREYATVAMRFSMIDVTTDSTGRVVDGSPTERVTVTEFWTFLRSSGGHWILSAIQQAK